MPNKQRKSKNIRRPRRSAAGRTVRVPFHAVNSITLAGSTFNQVVGPYSGLSGRSSSIADTFDEYRLVKLRYRIRQDVTTASNQTAMAFYPGVTTNNVNSLATIGENPYVSMRVTDDDVILPYTHVPRAVLAGEQSWYKCQKATLTADDAVPGQLFFTGNAATDVINYEVDGIFEFRGEADPTNTPLDPRHVPHKIDLLNRRVFLYNQLVTVQRDNLLKLLNYKETLVTVPQLTVHSEGTIPAKWPTQTPSQLRAQVGYPKL